MQVRYHFFTFFLITQLFFSFYQNLEAKERQFNFDFSINNNGWQGDFTDYPVGEETFFELAWGWTSLPAPLTIFTPPLTQGLFLSGNNHSDDLFMFVKRQIRGLKPRTNYELFFEVTIENNIPPGQVGIGGSPGESVFFKVGASTIKPNKVDVEGFYLLNVDKGNQSTSGKNAIVVGNLANPLVNPLNPTFEPKQFANTTPLIVRTDRQGRLWLFVGTDSGFEGSTLYYIAKISVTAISIAKKTECRN